MQRDAEWLDNDAERLNTPKDHQLLHFIAFMLMYGAVDLARLNNTEADHVPYVKDAVKRTWWNYSTMMGELHRPVDRMEAMQAAKAYERPPLQPSLCHVTDKCASCEMFDVSPDGPCSKQCQSQGG